MRSRNQRSWEMTTAQPANASSASSSARSVSTSRSLVGSSSSSRLPPRAQQLGEVQAVALAAGELADLLLLVGALEVEAARRRRASSSRGSPTLIWSVAAGDLLPHGLVRRRARRATGRRRRARRSRRPAASPRVGLLLAGDHPEQRRLAGAVGADHADDAAARQREATGRRSAAGRRSPCAGSSASTTTSPSRGPAGMWIWTWSSLTLRSSASSALVAVQARLALRRGGPWGSCAPTRAPAAIVRWRAVSALLLLREALLLLLEPGRVVALEGDARGRGRARGSSRRRCRGSSGRG